MQERAQKERRMDEKVKATQSYSRVCEALGDENIKESSGAEGLEFTCFEY